MGPSVVFVSVVVEVNNVNEANEEKMCEEMVVEVFGEMIIDTQEDGTQYMIALRMTMRTQCKV